ncbi:MAG: M48 family metalloprotease [Acidobacteriota bacterium]|nr:M48 family metalloprotease [Acidobacteriota bacterium]
MRRLMILATLLSCVSAHAQLGGILDKIQKNKDKIGKGAKVAQAATHEFTEAEEADIGRVVAARVLKTYPLAKNDKLQQYVTLVGNTVAAYSARPTLEWHFGVLQTDVVNAFSCPGGFVFITTGALAQIHSEAELAAVLGHEIAHATQKHILKEVKRANTISATTDFAKTTASGSFLNDSLGEKIGNLAYEKLFTTGLSRRDEEEADKIGVQLAADAGYRAAEFVNFLDALSALEGKAQMKVLTATHPSPADRKKYVQPLAGNANGEVLAERWAAWTQPSKK